MPLIAGTLTLSGELVGEPIRSPLLMSRFSGKRISDTDHILQGIADILTTRIGSRVLLRDYGSELPDLIDQPITRFLIARVYAAVIIAINRWETRVRIVRVTGLNLSSWNEGKLSMTLEGYYRATRRPLRLSEVSLDFYRDNTYALNFDGAHAVTTP